MTWGERKCNKTVALNPYIEFFPHSSHLLLSEL